jgi:prepilin-type processing-associated H-X9-DG protein
VVISIIAILASLLLPAITLVRTSARAITCQSNQRQIGMALQAYALDWDGMMPPAIEMVQNVTWSVLVTDYIEVDSSNLATKKIGVWRCPENKKQVTALLGFTGYSEFYNSYGANGWNHSNLPWDGNFLSAPVARIGHASDLFAMGESAYYRMDRSINTGANCIGAAPGSGLSFIRYVHRGRSNMLYADNHSAALALVPSTGTRLAPDAMLASSWSNGLSWLAQ